MAKLFDRVKETSTTTGTGNLTLAGAASGYLAFQTVFATGADQIPYAIVNGTTEWEVGYGTLSASTTFVRNKVTANSSGTFTQLSLAAGTKDVFVSLTADAADETGRTICLARGYALP